VLAMASHDLRNPLSTIGLHAALIRRLAQGDARIGEPAERIQQTVARMSALIDQLLDLGRIEAGRITLAPREVDARAIVSELTSSLTPIADDRRIHLAAELPGEELPVLADRDRIAQVLSNLVGNALKFTPEGGSITVRVARDGAAARFSVADTGPGIPAEHLAHLFDRYWRGPGSSRAGAGLGLFIVRGLVEAHGGRVWVESAPGAGSTFSFTLPAAERRPP
jgi:signal transduction histidine kinase